jgi:hypothetical protein
MGHAGAEHDAGLPRAVAAAFAAALGQPLRLGRSGVTLL